MLPRLPMPGQHVIHAEGGERCNRLERLPAVMRRRSGNDSRASKTCVRVERDKRVSGEQYPAIGEQEDALSVGVPGRGDHLWPARKVQDGTGLQLAIRCETRDS